MVLSDLEILMELQSRRLVIDPSVEEDQISPSAIDLQLGYKFTELAVPDVGGVSTTIDLQGVTDVEEIAKVYGKDKTIADGGYYLLPPKGFVLAYTKEYIKLPEHLSARVEGRSSFARLGLSIHQTAPTVHATFRGQLRLEILNNGPFECKLSPGLRICQLILERLGSPALLELNSRFQGQTSN